MGKFATAANTGCRLICGIMVPLRTVKSLQNLSHGGFMASSGNWLRNKIVACFSHRWLATIILIIIFDVTTFFAFAKTSGSVPTFPHQDKVIHALAFFILTILGHLSLNFDFFRSRKKFSLWLFGVNCLIWGGYGLAIEMGQKFLGYRQASVGDVIADLVGIGLGSLTVIAMKLYPKEGSESIGKEKR